MSDDNSVRDYVRVLIADKEASSLLLIITASSMVVAKRIKLLGSSISCRLNLYPSSACSGSKRYKIERTEICQKLSKLVMLRSFRQKKFVLTAATTCSSWPLNPVTMHVANFHMATLFVPWIIIKPRRECM
jgi:hypothetical protein